MQRPGEPGAVRFGPHEGCADHRPHRYRSFMIEEILTEPPGPKGAAPAAAAAAAAGELLKFGVQALLAARPFHSHLGMCGVGADDAGSWAGGGRAAKTQRRARGPGTAPSAAGQGSGGAGIMPRRNQASCPRVGLARRVFGFSFSATLWPPAREGLSPGTKPHPHRGRRTRLLTSDCGSKPPQAVGPSPQRTGREWPGLP